MSMRSTLRTIADSKHEGIQSASPEDLVSEAVDKMVNRNIGALVVLDEEGGVVGVFSERDLLTRVVGQGLDAAATKVSEVMTPDPLCVEASLTVEDAMRKVTEEHVRHLPLVTGSKLEGLISSGDLTAWAVKAQEEEIEGLSHKLQVSVIKNKALIILFIVFAVLIVIGILTS